MVTDADWWRQAVVYQVYPRSFADANGDGIGDLSGVTSRIPYLVELGVDALWLSPFYPSALADGGYDVDDHRGVDPRLGTLADFDELVQALHAEEIRLIVDIVPNHTSNRHRWFEEALVASPGSAARDRYVFRDGTGPDGSRPPSDWDSMFGGSAWERVPDGQWYLHLFAVEQPDLNWHNREVRDDFLETLRFWSDRGADGFRVDVAHHLVKDLAEPMPSQAVLSGGSLAAGSHPYEDRDEVHEIYAEWRRLFNSYSPPRTAVAEAWVDAPRRARYASQDGLGQAFNFDLLEANWDPQEFRTVVTANLALARESGASSTWVLSNHDVVRHPTRYGLPQGTTESPQDGRGWLLSDGAAPPLDCERGARRARAATMLVLALPGSAYLYQGEELGLHEVGDLPAAALQDPVHRRSRGAEKGRDGCRVPLPWATRGPSLGFGDSSPHLPQPDWFTRCAVDVQDPDPDSMLSFYRRALALRRRLVTTESLDWVDTRDDSVLHVVRPNGWHCIVNFGSDPVPLPPGSVVLTSTPFDGGALPAEAAAWVR
ncbi:MAG: glycoside hydrolase family 13 protein [Nocardioidaceae bacterium]